MSDVKFAYLAVMAVVAMIVLGCTTASVFDSFTSARANSCEAAR